MRKRMKIIAAAVRLVEGDVHHLPPPARHHNVMRMVVEIKQEWATGADSRWRFRNGDEQGFLTECGRFLTRRQALAVARKNDQIISPIKGNILTSENLW